uniref:Peptidoglycan endopeptidase n=1 Tax=Thermodesulfobacterium geofontis TaxID=1295609 RepID=A0A7V4JNZ3_9BACT
MERKFFYIFSFFLIIITFPLKAFCKSQSLYEHNLNLKYIPYLVKKGDTLYSIAKKYNVSVEELKKINNLQDNNISIGQILRIPVNKKLNFSQTFKNSENFSSQENKPISYHKVAKGETLYSISKKYGIPIQELKKLNNLKTTKLKVGQTIKIYQNLEKTAKKLEEKEFILYEVKEGDTLYTISLKHNVSIELIKDLNGIKDNVIFVGQKLKIPCNPLEEELFVLENPAIQFEEKPKELLSQKFSVNFLSKSFMDEKDENLLKKKFLEISKQFSDYLYKLGGNGNGYLDCSMFVKLVYEELGIELPRTSREQFLIGIDVEKEELIPGDLLFFSKYRDRENISHVGIYIGDNKFVHFSSSRRGLSINSLDEPYFNERFVGAKRILNGEILEQFYKF